MVNHTFDVSPRNATSLFAKRLSGASPARESENKTTDDMYALDLSNNSSEGFLVGDGTGRRLKRLPGETKTQAIERDKIEREHRRVLKFMRFAYPRQREAHHYKKKMLDPDQMNTTVDLTRLKQEFARMEKERLILKTSNTKTSDVNVDFFQLDS